MLMPSTFAGMYLVMLAEHANRELTRISESGQLQEHLRLVEREANRTLRQIAGKNPTLQRLAEAREVVIAQMLEEVESSRMNHGEA